ncbi:hypothetical protein GCM10027290_62300 [Micromonospora sonneratiae]|uniref:Proteins of 100 residues with WXG n=1 Tax=Micromonospora sonneratiae TaxID=1184706 RepID=A0ABW3YE44_9ACTN
MSSDSAAASGPDIRVTLTEFDSYVQQLDKQTSVFQAETRNSLAGTQQFLSLGLLPVLNELSTLSSQCQEKLMNFQQRVGDINQGLIRLSFVAKLMIGDYQKSDSITGDLFERIDGNLIDNLFSPPPPNAEQPKYETPGLNEEFLKIQAQFEKSEPEPGSEGPGNGGSLPKPVLNPNGSTTITVPQVDPNLALSLPTTYTSAPEDDIRPDVCRPDPNGGKTQQIGIRVTGQSPAVTYRIPVEGGPLICSFDEEARRREAEALRNPPKPAADRASPEPNPSPKSTEQPTPAASGGRPTPVATGERP